MMKAWVVSESMYGNTRGIAEAVAQGAKKWAGVEVHEVSTAATSPADVDVLLVGAPTHAFGLSRPSTRADAAPKGHRAVESATTGVREWLHGVVDPESFWVAGSEGPLLDDELERARARGGALADGAAP